MKEFKCPICGGFPVEEILGADLIYCYKIGRCENGHRFGMKWKGDEDELGRGREIAFGRPERKR